MAHLSGSSKVFASSLVIQIDVLYLLITSFDQVVEQDLLSGFDCLKHTMTLFHPLSILYQGSNLVLPSTANPIFNITLNSNFTGLGLGQTHCTERRFPWSHPGAPDYADRLAAIQKLPQTPDPGAFHNQAPHDPFRLPIVKISRKCAVLVQINAGSATTAAYGMDTDLRDGFSAKLGLPPPLRSRSEGDRTNKAR